MNLNDIRRGKSMRSDFNMQIVISFKFKITHLIYKLCVLFGKNVYTAVSALLFFGWELLLEEREK